MKKVVFAGIAGLMSCALVADDALRDTVQEDYDRHLRSLFIHFHTNPELSMAEHQTAARMAIELTEAGFDVTTGIGKTGLVAMLENGPGPLVMMRADMDGLPVREDSGLEFMSEATQMDPFGGGVKPVMHACGHDVHITSLVGTGRYMAANRDKWSGTLMLVGQPAEERIMGARKMMQDGLYDRFGKPDYALAFHVTSDYPGRVIKAKEGVTAAGSNSVDIYIKGVGTHGAAPQHGKDPIVLGSQIVLALQTLVSRELGPLEPGVVTVGAFNAGFKHNIIPDSAHLQLTVRNLSIETRDKLLDGIRRIAENMGRAAGLPEDLLPEVVVSADEATPPMINTPELTRRLQGVWTSAWGKDVMLDEDMEGMGAEDFPWFTTDPAIPSVYWTIGGTPRAEYDAAKASGTRLPPHHSPFFRIDPGLSVPFGVETTVLALMELMGKPD